MILEKTGPAMEPPPPSTLGACTTTYTVKRASSAGAKPPKDTLVLPS